MEARVLELTAEELADFRASLLEKGRACEEFTVTAMRYEPTHGATTEIVTVTGRVWGQYARQKGAWVREFSGHLREGLYDSAE